MRSWVAVGCVDLCPSHVELSSGLQGIVYAVRVRVFWFLIELHDRRVSCCVNCVLSKKCLMLSTCDVTSKCVKAVLW